MGLLDWLTDGTLGNMGGISGGESGSPPPMNMPQPPTPMPPVQQTGSDAPAIAPPPQPNPGAMTPPVDPSTQAIGGGTGAGPGAPTPDPTPAAGPPDPPIPLPAPRPPGANAGPPQPTFAPGQTNTNPISPPAPGFNASPVAPGGGALTPADAKGVVKSYEAAGGHAFAPPDGTSGASAPGGAYKLGDQTALGRALGIDPHSKTFNDTLGGLGAGLTAAGNSKGKSPMQALSSGAGATLEGANKEAHASNKDAQGYLAQAIAAKKAGDDATYKTNYTAYLAAKLKSEQEAAASKDATVANKNDSPTQLFLAAQRNVAADPLVKGSLTAYQAAIKDGDPTKIATAKSAYEQTVQERQSAHLAGVGLHPQTAAEVAKQPGMTQANPLDAGKAGITPANIGKKLQPGQYYTNPADGKVYQYKGAPDKAAKSSSATPAVSKPEPANPVASKKVAATTADDEDD